MESPWNKSAFLNADFDLKMDLLQILPKDYQGGLYAFQGRPDEGNFVR
jgi:hypothetical protein